MALSGIKNHQQELKNIMPVSLTDFQSVEDVAEEKWMTISRQNLIWFRKFIKENIEYFVKTAHHTDCFAFPEEYSFNKENLNIDEKPRSQILILDKAVEEITSYLSFYELYYHNTDNFTEDYESVEAKCLKMVIAKAALNLLVKETCHRKQLISRYTILKETLIFSENVVMLSTAGEEIGEISVNVEKAVFNKIPCVKVEINNHGVINGVPCGGNTIGYVSNTLETIFLKQYEYLITENKKIIKQIQMRVNKDKLFEVKHIITKNKMTDRKLTYYSSEDLNNFISEVACILVQRLLIKAWREKEIYVFNVFDDKCQLCTLTYEHIPMCKRVLDGKIIEIFGLIKCIKSSDISSEEHLYFDDTGLLLSQINPDVPIVLKAEEIVKVMEKEKRMKIKTKKNLDWENDAELSSQFLLKKEKYLSEYQTYMETRPDIATLIHDFVQALLVRKPADVLAYAAVYFSAFCPKPQTDSELDLKSDGRLRKTGFVTGLQQD